VLFPARANSFKKREEGKPCKIPGSTKTRGMKRCEIRGGMLIPKRPVKDSEALWPEQEKPRGVHRVIGAAKGSAARLSESQPGPGLRGAKRGGTKDQRNNPVFSKKPRNGEVLRWVVSGERAETEPFCWDLGTVQCTGGVQPDSAQTADPCGEESCQVKTNGQLMGARHRKGGGSSDNPLVIHVCLRRFQSGGRTSWGKEEGEGAARTEIGRRPKINPVTLCRWGGGSGRRSRPHSSKSQGSDRVIQGKKIRQKS